MKRTTIGKSRFYLMIAVLIFSGLMLSTNITAQTLIKSDINGPAGSVAFGSHVAVLPNGNFVVTDPDYSIVGGAQLIGAVYLYSRQGNLISTLRGSTANDRVGSDGITVLTNGNFVIQSKDWNQGAIADVGAVTFGRMTTGVSGVVSNANSLVGSTAFDFTFQSISPLPNGNYVVLSSLWNNGSIIDAGAVTLGRGNVGISGVISPSNSIVGSMADDEVGYSIRILSNGNYVIISTDWNDDRGAATFGTATVPLTGVVSSANSLVGSTGGGISTGDNLGRYFTTLSNGNYVVYGSNWDNGTVPNAGFATFGNGSTGVSGEVSVANSIVGTTANDSVGSSITPLTNGNYVIGSPFWNNGTTVIVGAATFCGNPNGCIGLISSSNSLIGSRADDRVGRYITSLTNGNYVVRSPDWDNGTTINVGAVTFGNSTTGVSGTISTANSLVGSKAEDMVGSNSAGALSNGNYVVASPLWDNGTIVNAGAVTFGNGNIGITGLVSTSNSLVGSIAEDQVGNQSVTSLTNGNYVVSSTEWDNGTVPNVGAVTFGNGTTGITGSISNANSLIGSIAEAQIGSIPSIRALSNGNYVVNSSNCCVGRGAVTFGNGTTGVSGTISSSNSLIGSTNDDNVGSDDVAVFSGGKYVVKSDSWDNGATIDAGAITVSEGANGITGIVSPSNSLVGTQTEDLYNSSVIELANGYYYIISQLWDNGTIGNAGAVTFSNTPVIGEINSNNSILGTVPNDFRITSSRHPNFSFDESINRLYVGRPLLNKVTLASLSTDQTPKTKFDFDGDGKSDLSIFRPAPAEWWLLRSSDGGNNAYQFGQTSDKIVPADYTGDGKTDIAFWRESTGEWFILRSEDSSFYAFPFGSNGDIPVPADYDGDGIDDAAVFRPSSATWFINNSSGGTRIEGFGVSTDKPIPNDYDGDGKADLAIWRPNGTSGAEFWLSRSTAGVFVVGFGTSNDKPVPGDYTGDGKDDVAFWRPTTGEWFILRSEDSSFYSFPFGANGDISAPGDYDGDGTFDATVFRPNSTTWFINGSTAGTIIQNFGISTDRPLANSYVP